MLIRLLLLFTLSLSVFAADNSETLLLVRNLGDKSLGTRVSQFEAIVGAKLTQAGFSVVDRKMVLQKFSETGDSYKKITEASAVNVAKSLNAKFVALVDLVDLAKNSRKFTGYNIKTEVNEYVLSTTIKFVRVDTGASIAAGDVNYSEKDSYTGKLATIDQGLMIRLFNGVAQKIVLSVSNKLPTLAKVGEKIKTNLVTMTIKSNVDAIVSVNGLVVGLTNTKIVVPAGINVLKVDREWFSVFERNVNFFEGQTLLVNIEMTDKGFAHYQKDTLYAEKLRKLKQDTDVEKAERLAAIEIAKERASGEIQALLNTSEGRKVMLGKSKFEIITDLKELNIGDLDGKDGSGENIIIIDNEKGGK